MWPFRGRRRLAARAAARGPLGITLGALLIAAVAWAWAGRAAPGSWAVTSNPGVPAVALTFDDGPDAVRTQAVLDVLAEWEVRATFFVIGSNVARLPDLARAIVEQGHELANHSMGHGYALPALLPAQVRRDYRDALETIREVTGVSPVLYRPPHGRLSPWMAYALRAEGARLVLWDVSPADWKEPAPEVIVERVLDRVRPGSIVLLHDGLDLVGTESEGTVVAALPALIRGLRDRGYALVTVSELLDAD